MIHHGGAGTTASVLHAGVPHIIVPHFGDQKFFAGEVRRLGVGISLRLSRWPEELPRAVRIVERSKKRLKKAKKAQENGRYISDFNSARKWVKIASAVAALEKLVNDSKGA